MFFLSLSHNFDTFAHRVPPIDRSYNTTVAGSGYTFVVGGRYLLRVSHPPNKSRTRVQVSHLALPLPPALMALAPLPPNSLQIQDSDPYRGPGSYILYTTLLLTPLTGVPYPSSNSASIGIVFVVAHGFVGLPTQDIVLAFHATSSLSLMLQPGSRYFVVTTLSLGAVSGMPQTMRGVVHM